MTKIEFMTAYALARATASVGLDSTKLARSAAKLFDNIEYLAEHGTDAELPRETIAREEREAAEANGEADWPEMQ